MSNSKKEKIVTLVKKHSLVGRSDKNKKMVDMGQICPICADPLEVRWGIVHGFGTCNTCGAPYSLYDVDGEGKRFQKLHCTLSESTRFFHRKNWKQLQEDGKSLEDFAKDLESAPELSKEVKSAVVGLKKAIYQDTVEKIIGTKQLGVNDMIKCIKEIEGRDLSQSEEVVELIEGISTPGILVHRKFLDNKDPVFYSYSTLQSVFQEITPLDS